MITVYHASREMFRNADLYSAMNPVDLADFLANHWDEFKSVATVPGSDLDVAYELTNSIHDVWWNNLEVSLCHPDECVKINDQWIKGYRSTSVGDIMVVDDNAYIVASFGFDPITIPEGILHDERDK